MPGGLWEALSGWRREPPGAAGLRAGRHSVHGVCGLFPDRVGFHPFCALPWHHGGARPGLGGREHRLLQPGDHGYWPGPLPASVWAIPEPGARVHAGYWYWLLLWAQAGGDRLCGAEIRQGPGGADCDIRYAGGQGRGARCGAGPGYAVRQVRCHCQDDPRGSGDDAGQGPKGQPGFEKCVWERRGG